MHTAARWIADNTHERDIFGKPGVPLCEPLGHTTWSNRWSTMPVHGMPRLRLPKPDRRAVIDFMPGSSVPVLRQPFATGDRLPYWCHGQPADQHALYDLENDPDERENSVGTPLEGQMQDMLRVALAELEAPSEHLRRLGLE